jgi:hypothetical protein
MPPVGFEPMIPASARPKAHTLDCAATGLGTCLIIKVQILLFAIFSFALYLTQVYPNTRLTF